MSKNIASSEFYELVSDVKVEFVNSDDKRKNTFRSAPEDQEQHGWNSNSEIEICTRDTFLTEIPSFDDEIDIKYEVNEIQHNPNSYTEDNLDKEPILGPRIHGSIDSEEKELKQLYLDLLQCERDCETCQKYIGKLKEHVRDTHAVDQPTCDPLHIDPLDLDQSSAIEMKCEVDEDNEGMDFSEESDANSNVESDSDTDLDYNASHDLNRNCKSGRKLGTDHTRDKTFTRKDNLIIHTEIHTGNTERPFKCEECPKGFERRNHLTIHMRSHTGERPYKCKECAKTFTTNTHLTVHMRVHSGEKPFKCKKCAKSFTTSSSLTVHMRMHTQEKPYKCSQCAESFSTRYYLAVHSRHHTGENQYKCEQCEKSFLRNSDLTSHMKIHTGERPYKCGQL